MTKPPAPHGVGTFAERIAKLQEWVRMHVPSRGQHFEVDGNILRDLLTSVREQQAALMLLVNSCDTQVRNKDGEQMGVRTPDRSTVAQARAVLAKYALEVPR